MMREADGGLKDRFGRLAYVWTGLRATGRSTRKAKMNVDGKSLVQGTRQAASSSGTWGR